MKRITTTVLKRTVIHGTEPLTAQDLLKLAGMRDGDQNGIVTINDETGTPVQILGEGMSISISFEREG